MYDWHLWEVLAIIASAVALAVLWAFIEAMPEMCKAFLERYFITSSIDDTILDAPALEESAQTRVATTLATDNNAVAMQQQHDNALLLQGAAQALAKVVKAGLIGETAGIKLVFGLTPSSTSTRYQTVRNALQSELALLNEPRFNPISPAQQSTRTQLGLAKRRGHK